MYTSAVCRVPPCLDLDGRIVMRIVSIINQPTYMETLNEFLRFTSISFILAAILAPLIINVLYNGGIVVQHVLMRNRVNEEFVKLQKHKSGTPTMGGLIVVIPFIVLLLMLVPESPLRNVFLVGVILFSLYGFIDEMLVKYNIGNQTFRILQETYYWRIGKLLLLIAIGVFVAWLMAGTLGIEQVVLWEGMAVPFTGLYVPAWSFPGSNRAGRPFIRWYRPIQS